MKYGGSKGMQKSGHAVPDALLSVACNKGVRSAILMQEEIILPVWRFTPHVHGPGKPSQAMSQIVLTTLEVAAFRKLGRNVDSRWVDWAVSMLEQGANSDSLCSLAFETKPFNPFEMAELVDNALKELNVVSIPTVESAARIIASIRVRQALDGKRPVDAVLMELSELCVDLDHLSDIYDFYLLRFASEDLKANDVQWYWPSATRKNIDEVIKKRFQEWIAMHPIDA
jgi:hypothetical protein